MTGSSSMGFTTLTGSPTAVFIPGTADSPLRGCWAVSHWRESNASALIPARRPLRGGQIVVSLATESKAR
jgi:hypothetical protein